MVAERLDKAMAARGLAKSRAKARALIEAGAVRVDGAPARRSSASVAPGARIEVAEDPCPWVSRGALKLLHALATFGLSPEGAVALDVGASTGGFTEALLARGAARVYALDVGRDQLASSLRADPRVTALEGVNAREIDAALVPEAPGWIVADVSFIALEKALAAPLALAAPGAVLVALVKPQFEVGRARVGKGGVVRDPAARAAACAGARDWLERAGWRVLGVTESPVRGGDGNVEYLIAARRP